MHVIRELLARAMSYKLLSGIFMFTLLIEVAYGAAAPLSLKYLVYEAFIPKDAQVFMIILLILLFIGLLNIGANMLGDYSTGKLSGEIVRGLRTELFDHLQKQPLSFYNRYRTGDLVTRFASDMASIEVMIRVTSPLFLKGACGVLLGLIMLFTIEWKLTLAMLAGSIIMYVGPRLLQGRVETANSSYKEAQERFFNTVDEVVKGHKTILNLHLQQRFKTKARKQIHELLTFGFNLHLINSLVERLPVIALLILNGIMIGYGGYLIFHDEISIGGFMAFFTLFLTVGQSASNLAFLIPILIETKVSFHRVGEILRQPALQEPSNAKELPEVIESIRMDRVSFGYTEQTLQLRDVSIKLLPGTYTAFVGPSGSGKSTALKLLARFYEPQHGRITINDVDLNMIKESAYRNASTTVSQDTFLFNATIRDNLLLDRTDVAEEAMIAAAKKANIHHVIRSWPEGYDTRIYQEGASLSGGERQRISIARALLRNPKLLLLDEVTSALDPAAEAEINALIQSLLPLHTIVSVTHRLDSIVTADQIHVFNEGRIVESGTHHELIESRGLYHSLWEKQHGFQLSVDGLHATVEADRLAKLPFFDGIEFLLLRNIASLFATEVFQEGDVIVREGEEGNKFYIIVRGIFEVLKRAPEGEETRVAILQDGDYFGEIALLKGIPRTATVKSIGPSVVLSMRREAFRQLTAHYPQILETLERTLHARL